MNDLSFVFNPKLNSIHNIGGAIASLLGRYKDKGNEISWRLEVDKEIRLTIHVKNKYHKDYKGIIGKNMD